MSASVPSLRSDYPVLDRAFRIAVGDLFSNIIPFQSGLLANPEPTIMAGLEYDSPWTRDAAINSWNGGSLIAPEAARNTLLGVLEREPGGIEIGGQYWDRVIWVSGAWHHYLVTGDVEFLKIASEAATRTLARHEQEEFDPERGLFRGGACFQDGVAGYPDRYARTNGSSGIMEWVEANPQDRALAGFGLPMMACSTNCLYFAAYRDAANIIEALGTPKEVAGLRKKAENLREAIVRNFWNEKRGSMGYLVDAWGGCDHQEGFGSAFALLFGVVDEGRAEKLIAHQFLTAHGIPCVWPTFDRYRTSDGLGFGRHSGTVWPHVQGFWADAVARRGRTDLLFNELISLAGKAYRDSQFTEIYHPLTGAIYGGRQEHSTDGYIIEWHSCRRQTWSATGLLRMVLHGVAGMRFDGEGISFEPCLAKPVGKIRLSGLEYRSCPLTISLEGTGNKVKQFTVNGRARPDRRISPKESGTLDIRIELADA
jgi:glycogen debranching enzyme